VDEVAIKKSAPDASYFSLFFGWFKDCVEQFSAVCRIWVSALSSPAISNKD
jgi:hypothetical protein